MEEIWLKICHHFDVPEDVAKSWYERIEKRLKQKDDTRAYHNWQEMMLPKVEHLKHCSPSIALAAFFQYYEFNGNCSCVEENCAAFEQFCADAMIDDELSKSLILKLLGTKSNDGELSTCFEEEANLLQDIDLVILGAPTEVYKRYTQMLRREYSNLDNDAYNMMRLRVLETLLMIPNIYSTAEFQTKYEEKARANIQQEISELKQ